MPEMPKAVRTIAETALEVQASPAWQAASDDSYQRAWLLTHAVCEALYLIGIKGIPSAQDITKAQARDQRDQDIARCFDGRNYRQLAARHGVSERTTRRIIEKFRRQSPPDKGG